MKAVEDRLSFSEEEHSCISLMCKSVAWLLLTREPDSASVEAVLEVLGCDCRQGYVGDEEFLQSRFRERFELPVSSLFVPPFENPVRAMTVDGASITFGPYSGQYSRHVKECYVRCGFDWRGVAIPKKYGRLREADSLAMEALFLGWIHDICVERGGDAEMEALSFGKRFALDHLLRWLPTFSALMGRQEEDCYSMAIGRFSVVMSELYGDDASSVSSEAV